jgi:hypothetical protein
VMEVETFRSLTPVERGEVEAEGRRLVGFLSPESAPTDVRIRPMA